MDHPPNEVDQIRLQETKHGEPYPGGQPQVHVTQPYASGSAWQQPPAQNVVYPPTSGQYSQAQHGYIGPYTQTHQPAYSGSAGTQPMGAPQQGVPGQWMVRPAGIPGCPPGLEYLTMVDQLLVHQQIEMVEVFLNWESANRYVIKNSMGQQVYFAAEESDVCARQCCGPARTFTIHITDNLGQEVIRLFRQFKCCAQYNCSCCLCGDCCANEVQIEAPPGNIIGYVKQICNCIAPKYELQDVDRQAVLLVQGPMCICDGPCCPYDQEFKVLPLNSTAEVGKICKQYGGFAREMFTTADNFGVTFPMDLDVKIKAVTLGAIFLIDFMFFERKKRNE